VERRRLAVLLVIALAALLGAGVAWRAGGRDGSPTSGSPLVSFVHVPAPDHDADAHRSQPIPARTLAPDPAPAPSPPLEATLPPAAPTFTAGTDPADSASDQPAVSLAVRFVDASGARVTVGHLQLALVSEAPDGPHGVWDFHDTDFIEAVTAKLDARFVGRFRLSGHGANNPYAQAGRSPLGLAWTSGVVTVTLAPGANGPVDLPLPPAAPLTVRLRDTEGRPLEGIALRLQGADTRFLDSSFARTGPDGVTDFAAEDSLVGAAVLEVEDERLDERVERALTLGTTPSTVDIVLRAAPPAGTLHVRVVDAQGRPAAYAGSVHVNDARIATDPAENALVSVLRTAEVPREADADVPREERFLLPPAVYHVSLDVGPGLAVFGPYAVASAATTTADVEVPPPGLLLVRVPLRPTPSDPEEVVALATAEYLLRRTQDSMSIRADGEARFSGLGPAALDVKFPDAPQFFTRVVLVSGETTVVDVPRGEFGGLVVRIVDQAGAVIADEIPITASLQGPHSPWGLLERETGSPPLDMHSRESSAGPGSPGVVRAVRVQPGRWTVSAEWLSVDVEVRPGETAEATLVFPVDAESIAPLRREARERMAALLEGHGAPRGRLDAIVMDEVGGPLTGAEVHFRLVSEPGVWQLLAPAGPGLASEELAPGAYLVRARSGDRPEGPLAPAVVAVGETTQVRLVPGPREETAGLVVRARAPGWPAPPWVLVSDARVEGAAGAGDATFTPRLGEADSAGRFEALGLPAGVRVRVEVVASENETARPPEERLARGGPASRAEVTLAPGERRELGLALPEAALVTAGPAAVVGDLLALAADTHAFEARGAASPEGQALAIVSGEYAIGYTRRGGGPGAIIEGLRAVTLAPGDRLAWPGPAPGDVTLRGIFRRPGDGGGDGAAEAWIVGPDIKISLVRGLFFSHDRLPAGRYALRIGGREVRSWEAAPGQTLDLGVLEGR